jgi:Flp pilus assembly protein TadD
VTRSPLAVAFAQHKAGRLVEAERAYRRLLAAAPDNPDIAMLLGLLLDQRGVHAEAVQHLAKAAAAKPADSAAHYSLALALQHAGRGGEAASSYRRALALRPDYLAARVNLANLLGETGTGEDAEALLRQGLALHGAQPDLHYNLARLLQRAQRRDQAIEHYRAALALKPDLPGALNNLGLLLLENGAAEEAVRLFEQGAAANPSNVELRLNLGNALAQACRFDDAVAAYRQAQKLAPDNADAHHFESFTLLLLGRLAEGWAAYEWRLRAPDMVAKAALHPQPRWNGRRDLRGRLLVWNEQGIGDQIMFLSLLPELAGEMDLVAECDPRMIGLFRRSLPTVEFVVQPAEGAGPPSGPADIAAQIPSGSLMRHLRPDLASFAGRGGAYLKADPERVAALRRREGHDRPRVGLAWHTTAPGAGLRRRIALPALRPLLQAPGVRFVDLQYGDHAAEIAALGESGQRLEAPAADPWTDLDGLAAEIAALDLIITIDNSTAHLAGALGVPCWVLLPQPPEWRWLLERTDCLWWPSLRLFRQAVPGDWGPVIAEAGRLLAEGIAFNRPGQPLS